MKIRLLLATACLCVAFPDGGLRACGINPSANAVTLKNGYVARDSVPGPRLGRLASLWESVVWEPRRRACMFHQQAIAFPCTSTIDCGLGMSSLEVLCKASGWRAGEAESMHSNRDGGPKSLPAGSGIVARRIPRSFSDELVREGYLSRGFADPGMGGDRVENYCLVDSYPGVFCLVHGGLGDTSGESARKQLERLGVRDEELLALAWDSKGSGSTAGLNLLLVCSLSGGLAGLWRWRRANAIGALTASHRFGFCGLLAIALVAAARESVSPLGAAEMGLLAAAVAMVAASAGCLAMPAVRALRRVLAVRSLLVGPIACK